MGELLDLSGEWRARPLEGDLHTRFVEANFDDRDWSPLPIPGHWRSHPDFAGCDGPVLHRRRFALGPAAPGRRRFLSLDGVFYYGDVWVDADYLGATEGYFVPHVFELADVVGDEHVLAVEVACPPQHDRTHKRLVTGVFSHWDCLDRAWNPGGIWRPVRIEETGPVRIARLRAVCTEATEERGRIAVDLTLDAGSWAAERGARLVANLSDPAGSTLAEEIQPLSLAAGDNHLSLTLTVDAPPRWWPWRLEPGAQPRCDLAVRVDVDGEPSDERALRIGFREVRARDWRFTINGEPMFLMGSNHGPTRMALAEATPEELARDVRLAVEANLDLLRVHAHVTRPELYDAADEAGLLLWQDFPLQWGYARGLRKQAVRQATAMVDLLAHHPSIALWCAHNEPLAADLDPGAPMDAKALARIGAAMFLPSWNKDVLDRSITRALRRADPSRPAVAHSGVLPGPTQSGTDSHLYFGWYHGSMDGLAPALRAVPRLARFVTELGAQAVPVDAAFMEPERWPDLDWDALFEHHACQRRMFDRYVPPGAHPTFEGWADATRAYQAALVQLQVEDLRRLRHNPTGGFCQFSFADALPAVTWSVLGHDRAPKPGYDALRLACRDVLPMVDPRTGHVHVASERREALLGASVTVVVDGVRRRFGGDVAGRALTYVGTVPVTGAASVVATLEHAETGDVRNEYGAVLLRHVRVG